MRMTPGTLADALRGGGYLDTCTDPETGSLHKLSDVRTVLRNLGISVDKFAMLESSEQNYVTRRVFAHLRNPPQTSAPPVVGAPPYADKSAVLHPVLANQYSTIVNDDLYRLGRDGGSLESDFVRAKLREWGYDPDRYAENLTRMKRQKLARRLLQEVHALEAESKRLTFDVSEKEKLITAEKARSVIFDKIVTWAHGPLRLEKPQGSSFHHLVDYSRTSAGGTFARALESGELTTPQLFVVDHDWHAAFSASEGFAEIAEWPLPYAKCCFEFRISGVRVLAFVEEDDVNDGGKFLHCVYGRDEHWCSDDYEYVLRRASGTLGHVTGVLVEVSGEKRREGHKFPDLTSMVVNQIRAVCIMLDARVAVQERREPSAALSKSRSARGRSALPAHSVVRLSRRRYGQPREDTRAVSSGRHVRLHWRRGHWRHYDRILDEPDPDVRTVDKANESGIWTSSQWINSMLVGDESLGFVEKEYRL